MKIQTSLISLMQANNSSLKNTRLKLDSGVVKIVTTAIHGYKSRTLRFSDCTDPTPISDLQNYTSSVNALNARVRQAIAGIPPGGLNMAVYASAVSALVRYISSLPDEFCINAQNQSAFDALNTEVAASSTLIGTGNSLFEGNLEQFVIQAQQYLSDLTAQCNKIDGASRDFRLVFDAYERHEQFMAGKDIEIWNISSRVEYLANRYQTLRQEAEVAISRAVNQIESNVEADASKFVAEEKSCEGSFKKWDTVDGYDGYTQYYNTVYFVATKLIPDYNTTLSRVPDTARIQAATKLAQAAVQQIEVGFKSFPTFLSLPANSDEFPHLRYGSDRRKFAGSKAIGAVIGIANAYFKRTSKKLYIGDMQYEHGGKMGIHRSHKLGLDSDVDGVEIGDVPNEDEDAAFLLATEILSAGAALVFYADEDVVKRANKWASDNGISGRLQVENDHKKHFHLRMPE